MKRHIRALISAALLLGGCGDGYKLNSFGEDGLSSTEQAGLGYNGLGYNGLGYNGLGYNGLGYNGLGYNGLGWTGSGWYGWNSTHPDWGLDTWINATDSDGDGSITAADREVHLQGLEYWVGCACPSGSSPTWIGNNPYGASPETRTFSGLFNLAPTWCSGSGPVPVAEQQAVSACLLSRLNVSGIHNALSVRGYESSLALGNNEQLFMAYLSTKNWGNLWETSSTLTDPSNGHAYTKTQAYGCYFPWGNADAQLAQDLQLLIGRICEWGACPGQMKSTGACTIDGSPYPYGDGSTSTSTGLAVSPDPIITTTSSGPPSVNATTYQNPAEADQFAVYRGNLWRQMTVYLGAWADLEEDNWKSAAYQCSDRCPGALNGGGYYPFPSCSNGGSEGGRGGYRGGCELPDKDCEPPSVWNICQTKVFQGPLGALSGDCKPATDCVGGRKLVSLPAGQWLRVNFTRPYRYDFATGSWVLVLGSVNEHKAGTLAFRYSNGSGTNAGILIQDLIRASTRSVSDFADTGGADSYKLHTVYPYYPVAPATPTDLGVDVAIGSDPARPFPQLDYVQMWVGPPIGWKPRELYWNAEAVSIVRGTVCSRVPIEQGTDLVRAGRVRFRPQLQRAKDVQLTLTHGSTTIRYVPGEDGWSDWSKAFLKEDLKRGTWDVCVTSTSDGGSLARADVEIEQG